MAKDPWKEALKNIDLSSIWVLVVGVILMLIPLIFLLYRGGSRDNRVLNTAALEQLGRGRGGFSFIQKSTQGKRTAPANLFTPAKSAKTWENVVQQVTSMPIPAQKFAGLPAPTRDLMMAQFDPGIRRANLMIEEGDPQEGVKILKNILESTTDNGFLHLMASQRLCRYYQAMGYQDELELESMRLLECMDRVEQYQQVAQYLRGCLEFMRSSKQLMAQHANHPAMRKHFLEITSATGFPVNATDYQSKTRDILSNPGILGLPSESH